MLRARTESEPVAESAPRLANGNAPDSSSCSSCGLKDGCLPRDLGPRDLDTFSAIAKLKRRIRGGVALYRTGDPPSAVYIVRTGTFKTVLMCRCGKLKITGFYLPGDLIGIDALTEGQHPCDAIALEDSEVCVIPCQQLEQLACTLPLLQKQLVRALASDSVRDHGLTAALTCMDAVQRVAKLLVELARRYHRLGYASDQLLLHMRREEVASYLGLSSETVSRVLTRMQSEGLLTVHQRHIQFNDLDRLARLSGW